MHFFFLFCFWVGTSCCDLEGGMVQARHTLLLAGDTASNMSTLQRAHQAPRSQRTLPGNGGGRGPTQPPGPGEAAQRLQEPPIAIGHRQTPPRRALQSVPHPPVQRSLDRASPGRRQASQGPGLPALSGAERPLKQESPIPGAADWSRSGVAC